MLPRMDQSNEDAASLAVAFVTLWHCGGLERRLPEPLKANYVYCIEAIPHIEVS